MAGTKKHYKITVKMETPYPIEFIYREEAGGPRAAIGRAFARLRKDMRGKPLRRFTLEVELLDSWPELMGSPDVTPRDGGVGGELRDAGAEEVADDEDDEEIDDEDEEEEEEEKPKKGKKKPEEAPQEEETPKDAPAEPEPKEDTTEEAGDDDEEDTEEGGEALNYDDLIEAIKKAKDQKELDGIIAKYVEPFDWTPKELTDFKTEIEKVQEGFEFDKDEKKPKKGKSAPGKDAFADVMALTGKKSKK